MEEGTHHITLHPSKIKISLTQQQEGEQLQRHTHVLPSNNGTLSFVKGKMMAKLLCISINIKKHEQKRERERKGSSRQKIPKKSPYKTNQIRQEKNKKNKRRQIPFDMNNLILHL